MFNKVWLAKFLKTLGFPETVQALKAACTPLSLNHFRSPKDCHVVYPEFWLFLIKLL